MTEFEMATIAAQLATAVIQTRAPEGVNADLAVDVYRAVLAKLNQQPVTPERPRS
jgi:hypothetical protein